MDLHTESVNKQVYSILKKDILSRKLKPGERIDTKGIAEEYGISVMPVRSALLQLTTNGLVINRERVGFYVRQYSQEELRDIFEVRIMYELYCINMHSSKIDQAHVKEMIRKLEDTITPVELDELDVEMHRMIIYASNNSFLINEYEKLQALFTLGVYGGQYENVVIAKKEHLDIFYAILNGDVPKASEALKQHLERSREEIIGIYQEL